MKLCRSTLLMTPLIDERSDGIDALRAVLALWILFSHVVPWTIATQLESAISLTLAAIVDTLVKIFQANGETHPAVIGFIVLSGYCIHRNGFRHNRSDVLGYSLRRWFRIFPVYALGCVAGVIGFLAAVSHAPDLGRALSGTTALDMWAIVAKFLALSALVPPLHAATFAGNAPLHTVMVEIWLYAMYPVMLLVLAKRFGDIALWATAFGLWAVGTIVVAAVPSWTGWWHNGSLIGFLLYWWIGAKMVDPRFHGVVSRFGWLILALWGGLTFLIWQGFLSGIFAVEVRKLVFAVLFGIAVSTLDKSRVHFAWLRPLGRASYSMYALHAPFAYTLLIFGGPWWMVPPGAVLIGLASFWLVEFPLTKKGKQLSIAIANGRL